MSGGPGGLFPLLRSAAAAEIAKHFGTPEGGAEAQTIRPAASQTAAPADRAALTAAAFAAVSDPPARAPAVPTTGLVGLTPPRVIAVAVQPPVIATVPFAGAVVQPAGPGFDASPAAHPAKAGLSPSQGSERPPAQPSAPSQGAPTPSVTADSPMPQTRMAQDRAGSDAARLTMPGQADGPSPIPHPASRPAETRPVVPPHPSGSAAPVPTAPAQNARLDAVLSQAVPTAAPAEVAEGSLTRPADGAMSAQVRAGGLAAPAEGAAPPGMPTDGQTPSPAAARKQDGTLAASTGTRAEGSPGAALPETTSNPQPVTKPAIAATNPAAPQVTSTAMTDTPLPAAVRAAERTVAQANSMAPALASAVGEAIVTGGFPLTVAGQGPTAAALVIFNAAMVPSWPPALRPDAPEQVEAMVRAGGAVMAQMSPEEAAEYLAKMAAAFGFLLTVKKRLAQSLKEEKETLLGLFSFLGVALETLSKGLQMALDLTTEQQEMLAELALVQSDDGGRPPHKGRQRLRL